MREEQERSRRGAEEEQKRKRLVGTLSFNPWYGEGKPTSEELPASSLTLGVTFRGMCDRDGCSGLRDV